MLFGDKTISFNEAMSNAIASVHCNYVNMPYEKIIERATEIVRKVHPELFNEDGTVKTYTDIIEGSEKDKVKNAEEEKKHSSDNNGSIFAKHLATIFGDNDTTVEEDKSKNVVPAYEETTTVEEKPEAMNNNMAIVDLGTGLPLNPEQINKEIADNYDPSNPSRYFIERRSPNPNIPVRPAWNPQNSVHYNAPQQMPMQPVPQQPVPQMIPPQQMPMQMQPVPKPAPIHRVDQPAPPPKPVLNEDSVEFNFGVVDFDDFKKPLTVYEIPDFIQPKFKNPAPVANEFVNPFDNTEMIQKFNRIPLAEIEMIAASNGHPVWFEEFPNQMISVITLDNNTGKAVLPKCFTIDTGMIIDRRVKLIAAYPRFNPYIYLEDSHMYELFDTDMKTGRKVLDTKMINDVFVAGIGNITKKDMYTDSYRELNKKIALITLPTKGLNKEERNNLQNYIMKLNSDGYFDRAIQECQHKCRFVIIEKQLDKKHLTNFTMINSGVPLYYGSIAPAVAPIVIESRDGEVGMKIAR